METLTFTVTVQVSDKEFESVESCGDYERLIKTALKKHFSSVDVVYTESD